MRWGSPCHICLTLMRCTHCTVTQGRMYRVLNFFADLDRQMVISELALLLIRNWMVGLQGCRGCWRKGSLL